MPRRSTRNSTVSDYYAKPPGFSSDESDAQVPERPSKRVRRVRGRSPTPEDDLVKGRGSEPLSRRRDVPASVHAPRGASAGFKSKSKALAEDEDEDSDLVYAPRGASTLSQTKSTAFAEDADNLLGSEFEADESEEEDLEDIDNSNQEIEDEEHIPNPEVEEEEIDGDQLDADDDSWESDNEEEEEHTPNPSISSDPKQDTGNNPRCEQMFMTILEELAEEARSLFERLEDLSPSDMSMTLGFANLCTRLDLEMIVERCLEGIDRSVQDWIAKPDFSQKALLALPRISKTEKRFMVYAGFPTGELTNRFGMEGYVGSTTRGFERVQGHRSEARRQANGGGSKNKKRSFLYRQMKRTKVFTHFRRLAVFKKPIAWGYLFLLEGIMTILFDTYNNDGFYWKYNTKSSYALVDRIRAKLALDAAPSQGLNRAFQLMQGLPSNGRREDVPCVHCNMTIRYRKHSRFLLNPGDPLDFQYLCNSCGKYRVIHKELPSKDWVQQSKERRILRASRTTICEHCKFDCSTRPDLRHGMTTWDSIHKLQLCLKCHAYVHNNNGKLPSKKAIADIWLKDGQKKAKTDVSVKKTPTTTEVCVSCQRPGADRTSTYVEGKLCLKCRDHIKRIKRFPTKVELIKRNLMEDRKAGNPVICHHCGKDERDVTGTWSQSHSAGENGYICRSCRRKKLT